MLVSFLALILTVVGLERVKFEDVSLSNKAQFVKVASKNFYKLVLKN